MLASKFMDQVIAVDFHIQMVPAPPSPVPVPTPLPSPFTGMIFDPMSLAQLVVGDCPLMTAVAVAMDPIGFVVNMAADAIEGVNGSQVLINGVPATNTMTEPLNRWLAPHAPTPPAILFQSSGAPVLMGDAVYNLGSSSVWMNSRRAVRTLLDPPFTCGQPARLPLGMTLPIPLGAPVLVGGFPCPDLQAMISRAARKAVTARIKSAVNRPLTAALRMMPRGRVRTLLAAAKCHVTGDPVDVATGRMLFEAIDWELPGPLPVSFKREYSTASIERDGALGFGWSHTFEESVWIERGRVVYRVGDGREIQFDTTALHERRIGVGDEVFEPVNRLWLRCTREGFDVRDAQGRVHEFRRVAGDDRADRWLLVQIRSLEGHRVRLEHDQNGRLAWVHDSEGRAVRFEHDRAGRLVQIALPHPTEPGLTPHVRYEYSAAGDLVAVWDAAGNASRYQYSAHLMVQRTDRTGLSAYFGYDGVDASACCVRTWVDGGIYDHELVYDKEARKTFVTNSTGATRVYEMNEALLVVKMADAHGSVVEYAYDDQLRLVREVGPSGETVEFEYDARGNCTRLVQADGSERRMEFDERNLCTRIVEPLGSEIQMSYDSLGRLVRFVDAIGNVTSLAYDTGRLTAIRYPTGATTRYGYDPAQRVETVAMSNGGTVTRRFDLTGRVVEEIDPRGAVRRFRYSPLGDLDGILDPNGLVTEYRYDAEANLVEARTANHHVRMTYGAFHKVIARETAESRVGFEYDSENRLVAVINEVGDRHELTLDALGDVSMETGFDGLSRTYLRDASGRATSTIHPSGMRSRAKYDAAGRLAEVKHADGTFALFEYDARGFLVGAKSPSCEVKIERDSLGRVVRESQDGGATWIRSAYGPSGRRHTLESDLGARQVVEFDVTGDVQRLIHRRSDESDARVSIERDALGFETGREVPGGVRIAWKRDAAGRPVERETTRRRLLGAGPRFDADMASNGLGGAVGGPGDPLDTRSFQWRGNDQIAAIVNAATGPTFFDHDSRGRLVRERQPARTRTVDRAMDSAGNVYRSAASADRRYAHGGAIRSSADVAYAHDGDGNLVARVHGDERAWRYRWAGTGLLAAVERPDGSVVGFEYDAIGRRIRKHLDVQAEDGAYRTIAETRFVWDGNTVLHEVDSRRGATTWYWEPDSLAPVAKQQGVRTWSIATDLLGAPTEMYDDDGELAWQATADVFGVTTYQAGEAQDCPWRWPGQYEDEETGLFYNRWRYYDPQLGSYTSKDPFGLGGGFRPYGYPVDPILGCDPFGLYEPWEIARYGSSGHRGDGLDADELLGSVWLRENGYGDRSSAVGRENPAMAIDPGLHREITSAQREAGLFDHARVRRQSAYANIEANYRVRLDVLTAHFRSEGHSARKANSMARDVLDPLRREARRFAREHCGA